MSDFFNDCRIGNSPEDEHMLSTEDIGEILGYRLAKRYEKDGTMTKIKHILNIMNSDLECIVFYDGDYGNYFRIEQIDEYETLFIMLNNSYEPIKKIKITGVYLTEWLEGKIKRSDIVKVLDE